MQTNINTGLSYLHLQTTSYSQIGSMQINEKDFYSFLVTKEGLSENSVDNCIKTIRHINKWFIDKELSKRNIEEFLFYLKSEKKLKNSTLNSYLFVLRHLAFYCKDRGFPSDFLEGFKSFKKIKSDIIILTPDEIERLLATTLNFKKFHGKDCSFLDFRLKTLMTFLAFTGCRFSEAVNLKIKHLDLSYGRAVLVETKTNENRSVYFTEPLKSNLKKLIEGFDGEDLVFRNSLETKIHESDFSSQLKERALQAGITKRVYPHLFRHSFATQLLISGIDVAIVSKILGHKDVRTTVENYLHLADETLKEATFMHPLVRKFVDPLLIMQSVRDSLDGFHFETDKRFQYKIYESGKKLTLELSIAS